MNPFIWIEFEGVLIKQSREAIRLQGPKLPGAMGPFWIPRSCLGRVLFSNGTWLRADEPKLPLGKAVCVLEIDRNFAGKVGLA